MWHAGIACVGFQACAAHVLRWVQECDLIKDSFPWCIGWNTPTLINRDQQENVEHVLLFGGAIEFLLLFYSGVTNFFSRTMNGCDPRVSLGHLKYTCKTSYISPKKNLNSTTPVSCLLIQWTLDVLHSHPRQSIAYMFIKLYGFKNPITIPLPVQLESTFQCKYLWNSSTVECLSVQTYPFKTTEGELATMICLSLLQALAQNRESEGKKTGVFLPVCIQSKCSMSKGGFITTPKKNILPMMKTWLGDLGRPA